MAKESDALSTMKDLWRMLDHKDKGEFARFMIQESIDELSSMGITIPGIDVN